MYISQRSDDKLNSKLNELDKKFPVLKKLVNIFELFFDNEKLNITECCDGYFFRQLSVIDLLELSQYFLNVAKLIENNLDKN